jgi:hypothetical protein
MKSPNAFTSVPPPIVISSSYRPGCTVKGALESGFLNAPTSRRASLLSVSPGLSTVIVTLVITAPEGSRRV